MKPLHTLLIGLIIGALLGWTLRAPDPPTPFPQQFIDSLNTELSLRDAQILMLSHQDSALRWRIDSAERSIKPAQTRYRDAYFEGRSLPVPAIIDSLKQRPE